MKNICKIIIMHVVRKIECACGVTSISGREIGMNFSRVNWIHFRVILP